MAKKKKKLRVALIFGGTSEERKVSFETAKNVAANLNSKKYEVIPVEVSKEGRWLIKSETIREIEDKTKAKSAATSKEIVPVDKNDQGKIDVAFLALHGPGGEDGTVQGMLELLGIPYTCSGVLASALAMDKVKTKRLVASVGVLVAPNMLIKKMEYLKTPKKHLSKIRGKVVVKPNRIGSSFGVTISSNKEEIKKAINHAFKHDSEVMVEPYIPGKEFTVPVLGNKLPKALPVIEIIPKNGSSFFDFKAKYDTVFRDEIVPARISKNLTEKLQKIAVTIHELLDCRGVTRSDFIVTAKGEIYFLEINTIPGMTSTSLVPQSAAAAGMSYSQFLDKLIQLGLNKE